MVPKWFLNRLKSCVTSSSRISPNFRVAAENLYSCRLEVFQTPTFFSKDDKLLEMHRSETWDSKKGKLIFHFFMFSDVAIFVSLYQSFIISASQQVI